LSLCPKWAEQIDKNDRKIEFEIHHFKEVD
jgi:hypothetical protein